MKLSAAAVHSFLLLTSVLDSSKAHSSERLGRVKNGSSPEVDLSSSIRGGTGRTENNDEVRRTLEGPKRVFVRYTDAQSKQDVVASATELIDDFDDDDLVVVKVDDGTFERLNADSRVQVETDNLVTGFTQTRELSPIYASKGRLLDEEVPYGIPMIQADQFSAGDHNVTVCIVDTGYALGHPDLPTDVTGDNGIRDPDWKWYDDLNGHGSHVAGTIAAIAGNDIGVVGAGSFKLHITRGLDENAEGYESDVQRAVKQCVDSGAKIISLSLGSPKMSDTANELYRKIVEEDGVLVVAASGNFGINAHAYPASHPSVISVAAVYEWETYWEGSNFSTQVELAGPGYQVLSTTVSTSSVQGLAHSYPAYKVSGTPIDEVKGNLVYCGAGNYQCDDAFNAICLMVRDETNITTMLENCKQGGGLAAILFNAANKLLTDTNWEGHSSIPAVGVRHLAGMDLLTEGNVSVSVGQAVPEGREYGYSYFTGTSMATPHVAAAAALVWSHFPQCSNHQIRQALVVTAKDKGLPGCDWDYGAGIVQAKDAYEYLKAHDCSQGEWWSPTKDNENTTVCDRDILYPNASQDIGQSQFLTPVGSSSAPVPSPTSTPP